MSRDFFPLGFQVVIFTTFFLDILTVFSSIGDFGDITLTRLAGLDTTDLFLLVVFPLFFPFLLFFFSSLKSGDTIYFTISYWTGSGIALNHLSSFSNVILTISFSLHFDSIALNCSSNQLA